MEAAADRVVEGECSNEEVKVDDKVTRGSEADGSPEVSDAEVM